MGVSCVHVHLSLLSLQTSNYSGRRRQDERNGEACPPLQLTIRACGSNVSYFGGALAANDFGAFHVQFYAISRIL